MKNFVLQQGAYYLPSLESERQHRPRKVIDHVFQLRVGDEIELRPWRTNRGLLAIYAALKQDRIDDVHDRKFLPLATC